MNKLRLITLALLAGALTAGNARAQLLPEEGIVDPPCWRLVNGPGRGVVLHDNGGGTIVDLYFGAFGVIEGHGGCRCVHYHGTLFGVNEPDSVCGWGCVVPAPCAPASATDAYNDLLDVIDEIGVEVDSDLAAKLDDILATMESAAADGCYTVVDALADAFSEELNAYFFQFGYEAIFDPWVQDLAEYVNSRLAALSPPPFFPTLAPNTVRILHRIGSGSRGRLLDPGPRITLALGQMLTLQMLASSGFVNPYYLWQYKWKGQDEGVIPDAAAVAILANYLTVVAYSNTSLRLTGLMRDRTTGNYFRDTIMVSWSDKLVE